jgi:membrane fusion protein (multidrug efflux system)
MMPLLAVFIAGTVALNACGEGNSTETQSQASSEKPATPPLDYTLARPQNIDEVIRTDGELYAWQRVELQSEVNGRVVALHLPEGERVRKGKVLVRMDSRELRAELDQIEAELQLARKKWARQQTLQANDMASEETVEELRRDVRTREAERDRLRAAIQKTLLRAPFTGRVGLHNIVEGAYLNSQQVITELIDDRRLKLDFALAEQYTGQVAAGDTVTFTTNVNPDSPQVAVVYAVSPSIAVESRRLQVRAEVPNASGRFKPGLFAEVELPVRRRSRAIMIPNIALIPTRDRKEVFVYENGRARARALVTGFRSEKRVEVIQGLERGDTVLTSGLLQLQDGQSVQLAAKPNGGR